MRISRDKVKTLNLVNLTFENTIEVQALIPIQAKQRKRVFIDGEKNMDEAVKTLIDNLIKEGLL